MKRISLFILAIGIIAVTACTPTSNNNQSVASQLAGEWEVIKNYENGIELPPSAVDSLGGISRIIFFDMAGTTGKMSGKRNYDYEVGGWVVRPNFTMDDTINIELINNEQVIRYTENNNQVTDLDIEELTATNLILKNASDTTAISSVKLVKIP